MRERRAPAGADLGRDPRASTGVPRTETFMYLTAAQADLLVGRALSAPSLWHDTAPPATDWTPRPRCRRRRRRRGDRRRRLHRALDGLLPGRGRPVAADRGARGRDRRLRRLRPQRRLVLGAVPGLAATRWPRLGDRGRRAGPARRDARHGRRGRRGSPPPRASTPTAPRAAPSRWPATAAQLRAGPRRGRRTPGAGASARTTCALLDARRGARAVLDGTRTLAGATYTPDCAAIHPLRLVRGLAAAVERRGVAVHEQHPRRPAIAPGRVEHRRAARCAPATVRARDRGLHLRRWRASGGRWCRSTRW